MAIAGSYDFALQRGSDFTRPFRRKYKATGLPVDLTGYKARMQIRQLKGATGTSTTETLVLALEDGQGIEVEDAAEGRVRITLTSEQTADLAPGNVKTKLAYGIELYDDSGTPERVLPLLQGTITVLPETVR